MNGDFSDNEMKKREIYSQIRVFPPFAVRIDGRGFRRALSLQVFKKPYDERFARAMADSIELFFKESGLNPIFAFTFSDEISFFFQDMPFNNRVEKIDSIIPGFLSSALTINLKSEKPLSFDSRIIQLGKRDIYRYLLWRQAETWRNHINSYGYYTLLKSGYSENDAAMHLKNMKASDIHEIVFKYGTNLAETPVWQRCGIMVYREPYMKAGFDPIRQKEVKTQRNRIIQDWNPPIFKTMEGKNLIHRLITLS